MKMGYAIMKKYDILFRCFLFSALLFFQFKGSNSFPQVAVIQQTYCCGMNGYTNSCPGNTTCSGITVPASPCGGIGQLSCPVSNSSLCNAVTLCPYSTVGGGLGTTASSPIPITSASSGGASANCTTDLCCQRAGLSYFSIPNKSCEMDPMCAINQNLVSHVCVENALTPTPVPASPTPSPSPGPLATPSPHGGSQSTSNGNLQGNSATYSNNSMNGGIAMPIQNTDVATNWDLAVHRCDAGNIAVPSSISQVSSRVPPIPNQNETMDANGFFKRFNNTINRKLACCLNVKNPNDTSYTGAPTSNTSNPFFEKFDCDENPADKTKSFDDLWSSTSDDTDLGQPNALLLVNSAGKTISGFYTIDLKRCDEFSEFVPYDRPIIPGVLTPVLTKDIQQATIKGSLVGATFQPKTPISVPTSPTWISIVSGINKSPPNCTTHPEDCRRCPILVRAVMVSTCPLNDNYTYPPNAPAGTIKHCAAAASVTIYVKLQQVFEIAGSAPIKTMDTVIENGKAVPLSVDQLVH